MTLSIEDAVKVVKVASEADSACTVCFSGCLAEAKRQWPDVDWIAALNAFLAVDSFWDREDLVYVLEEGCR